jgi:hypothetical protein
MYIAKLEPLNIETLANRLKTELIEFEKYHN